MEGANFNLDLANIFECPVCLNFALPPMLQCSAGHLVCSNCRPKVTMCPTRRGPLGNCKLCFLFLSFNYLIII